MGVHKTTTFMNGNSEAVHLPKGMGFGVGTAVRIEREPGGRVVLTPVVDREAERRELDRFLADMIAIGRPDKVQDREAGWFDFPDRPGLYK